MVGSEARSFPQRQCVKLWLRRGREEEGLDIPFPELLHNSRQLRFPRGANAEDEVVEVVVVGGGSRGGELLRSGGSSGSGSGSGGSGGGRVWGPATAIGARVVDAFHAVHRFAGGTGRRCTIALQLFLRKFLK